MGVIFYNGLKSTDYGIQVVTPPGYHAPALDVEYQHIPGRNGDIPIISDSYQNVTIPYDISFGKWMGDFSLLTEKVLEWTNTANMLITDTEYDMYGANTKNIKDPKKRYCQLYDTYDPSHYRMAMLNAFEIENVLGQAGTATIEFNCKPERYIVTPQEWVTAGEGPGGGLQASFTNTTQYTARPIYYIEEDASSSATASIVVTYVKYFKGSMEASNAVLDNLSLSFSKGFDKMYIDMENLDFVYQGENKSSYVNTFYTITGYPYLPPGAITVRATASIKTLKIKPRLYDI